MITFPMADYANLLPTIQSALDGNFTCAISQATYCSSDTVNCDNYLTKLPKLSFELDSTVYELPASAYAFSYQDRNFP